MEPMRQCEECGGWIRSFSGNDCTCTPQKQYHAEPAAEERRYTVVDDTVNLNRHQRRRLLAKKRKAKNKKVK